MKLFEDRKRLFEENLDEEIEVERPRPRTLHLQTHCIDVGTDSKQLIVHIRDITLKKNRRERDARADKLSALSLLAAGVAHEIGNPLNSLGIHIELMEREIEKLPKRKQKSLRSFI
ncbi:MAG: hypothetical protein KAI64_07655, partial [Thermoplasmata archaeon]|nr:hypothetical protein [Thermoplasmata archaeon]